MKILTAAQMQGIDRLTTEKFGIPGIALMENAARGVVEVLESRFRPLENQRIAIFCGGGNNGGDGFAAARLLKEGGLEPRVLLFADPESLKGDAAISFRRYSESGTVEVVRDLAKWRQVMTNLSQTTLIVDALVGTGLSRPLGGLLREIITDLNSSFPGAHRVAVDLPSGLSADSGKLMGDCFLADASVTFTAPKHAHVFPPACEKVGRWTVKAIGTPEEALEEDPDLFLSLICRSDAQWLTAKRPIDSHKGLYGHVLVLAGSVGKTGASAMAAKSALRSGAGLITVATPASVLPSVAGFGMEIMTEALPETEAGTVSLRALDSGVLPRLMDGKSVLAVGPGLGGAPETAELIRRVVKSAPIPLVLDADGLNAFAGRAEEIEGRERTLVLTPHPGEMARLLGISTGDVQSRRIEIAREFAIAHQVHLVLKGCRTLIASPDGRVAVNATGNPGMATAGAGDCLTGMIAALLGQFPRKHVSEVVEAAVYLHGLAGDFAARKLGEASMIAGDLIESIPEAWQSLSSEEQQAR